GNAADPSSSWFLDGGGALARKQEHDASVRDAGVWNRSAHVGARPLLPFARRRQSLCRRRVVLSLVRGGQPGADDRRSGSEGRGPHQREGSVMRARSFSHAGITVSDFNKAVKCYWEIFGCPLVGVADTPPERVRTFFGVDGPRPGCKIGWIRVPGGGV